LQHVHRGLNAGAVLVGVPLGLPDSARSPEERRAKILCNTLNQNNALDGAKERSLCAPDAARV
jgi:hypothetical protein